MSEIILERSLRLELRAQAHHLQVGVLVGEKGLTEAVIKEIDRALSDHGLVKVHVAGDDRLEREAIYHDVAETLGAARIQSIGKMLVFYRPVEAQRIEPQTKVDILMSKADPGAKGIKKPASGKKTAHGPKPPASRKEAKRMAAKKKRTASKKSALS